MVPALLLESTDRQLYLIIEKLSQDSFGRFISSQYISLELVEDKPI